MAKVLVLYCSMQGRIEIMAKAVAESGLRFEGPYVTINEVSSLTFDTKEEAKS